MKNSVEVFDCGDDLYQQWLAMNSAGYVVNARRSLKSTYMVLHRATCPSIHRYRRNAGKGAFTVRSYVKACARELEALRGWVRQHGRGDGSFSKECGLCIPGKKGRSS